MIGVEVEDNIDVISQLFPSFYQSSNQPNEFLIYDVFQNVLKTVADNVNEVFKLHEDSAKVMLNDRYVTLEKVNSSTKVIFGEFVDHVICRIYCGRASFWDNNTFSSTFENAATLNHECAKDLADELSQMYDGDIAIIPLKKLLTIKKICSRVF
jgi:hypothetical protein